MRLAFRWTVLTVAIAAIAACSGTTEPCAPATQASRDTLVWRDSTGKVVRVDSITIKVEFSGRQCRGV